MSEGQLSALPAAGLMCVAVLVQEFSSTWFTEAEAAAWYHKEQVRQSVRGHTQQVHGRAGRPLHRPG